MTFYDVMGAAGGAATVAALVAAAVARWIGHRLETAVAASTAAAHAQQLEAVRHEYASELEKLRLAQQAKLAEVNATESRLMSEFGAISSLQNASHAASFARRVSAVETIWKATIKYRDLIPAVVNTLDLLESRAPLDVILKSPEIAKLTSGITYVSFGATAMSDPDVKAADNERPFAFDVWQLFFGYRAFVGSASLHMLGLLGDPKPWHQDSHALALLRAGIPSPEFDEIMKDPRGKLADAQRAFESAIVGAIDRLLSGEKASSEAVTRVKALQQAIRESDALSPPPVSS